MQQVFNESEEGNEVTASADSKGGEQQEQTRIIPTAALPQGPHFNAKNCRGMQVT